MQAPFDKQVKDFVASNPAPFDQLLTYLDNQYVSYGLIGDTNDETLRKVYKLAGLREALQDVRRSIGL